MKRGTLSHGPRAWCPSSRGGKGLYEEACAVVPQAGLCEGEALGSAGSNTVTLPKPKGGSKRGTQSRPKHCTRPLYSTCSAIIITVAAATNHCERTDERAYRHEIAHRFAWVLPLYVLPSCECVWVTMFHQSTSLLPASAYRHVAEYTPDTIDHDSNRRARFHAPCAGFDQYHHE
jgi:hypothetical protein